MGVDNSRGANPFDDGWDEDGWDLYDDGSDDGRWPPDDQSDDQSGWADAELDGHVRQRLATLVPLRHEAFDRWDELQPRMTRARRRRHAVQALATSVLVAAIALVGVQGATRFLPQDTSVVSAADGGEGMSTSDSQRPMVGIGEASSTISADGGTTTPPSGDATEKPGGEPADGEAAPPDDGTGTDAPVGEETSLPVADEPGSVAGSSAPVNGGSAASSVSIPPPTTTTAPTSSPTSRSTSTTRAPTSTTWPSTTTTRATTTSTTVITARDLSTIDVTVHGTEIRLVAIHNAPGVTSQVHNGGPEKIEITFTKGSEKHDLVATVRNGNVVTSIVDSDDD